MSYPPLTPGTASPATIPGPWTFWVDKSVSPYTPFGQLILSGFTATSLLSDYGAAEATIPVATSPMLRPDLLAFWSWRLWAFYNGVPVWAGLPTGLTDQGGTAVVVSLTELPGYLTRKQYATAHTYTQVEQTVIAADLAANLSNIGVAVSTSAGSGILRDRDWAYLEDTSRGDLLVSLMQVNNGAQFRAEYALSTSTSLPSCTLRIAYPRVGVAGQGSGLALVVPGGAASFQATWTSDMMRTRTFAVGDVADGAPVTAQKPVIRDFRPQAGVPPLDSADDWPGVVTTSTLTERAATNATIYAGPTLALTAVMPIGDPPLGSYGVGDDVSVVLADPLLPAGLATTGQLTEIDMDAAAGTATWTVAITQPKPRLTNRLSVRLAATEHRLRGVFHNNLVSPPTGIET